MSGALNCQFIQNSAVGKGGGLGMYGCHADIDHCSFTYNTAIGNGGGVSINNGVYDIVSCTITENTSDGDGGGICLGDQPSTILVASNTDIVCNVGELGQDGYVIDGASALLTCCMVELENWGGAGAVTLNNDGCTIGAKPSSWGAVKSMYR